MWIISEGSYSDYRVLAACHDKDMAERLVERITQVTTWRGAFVEELYVATGDEEPLTLLELRTLLSRDDGHELEGWPKEATEIVWPWNEKPASDWSWIPSYGNRSSDVGCLLVRGTDHERVRKVFSDRRAMFIADKALRDSAPK